VNNYNSTRRSVRVRTAMVRTLWTLLACLMLAQLSRAVDDPDLTPQQKRERALSGDVLPPRPSEAAVWAASVDPLPNGGWEYVGAMANDEGMFFVSNHNVTRSGTVITIWSRWEYRSEQTSQYYVKFRSSVTREEVDCTRQASRVLIASYYLQNNMDGEATSYSYEREKALWSPSVPGTVGEYLSNWVCSRFKPNHKIGGNGR